MFNSEKIEMLERQIKCLENSIYDERNKRWDLENRFRVLENFLGGEVVEIQSHYEFKKK